MADANSKQRLLRLLAYLRKFTDVDHQVTIAELSEAMGYENAESGRKTLSADLKIMQEEGMGIEISRGAKNTYYYDDRTFEKAEVRLLTDAVLSARFISRTRSRELVKKLGTLVSKPDAGRIRRHIYSAGRLKYDNRLLYNNIELLLEAMERQLQVSFQYFDYNILKERVLRHDGKIYRISPYDLVWDEEFYYVLATSEEHPDVGPYRVDRICNLKLLPEPAVPAPKSYSPETYVQQSFHMFGGDETEVVVECENEVMRSIIDRFGVDVNVWKSSEATFRAKIVVGDSRLFYGWVFASGGKVKIISPEQMVGKYRGMLEEGLKHC